MSSIEYWYELKMKARGGFSALELQFVQHSAHAGRLSWGVHVIEREQTPIHTY
jgi:hypothetical protein